MDYLFNIYSAVNLVTTSNHKVVNINNHYNFIINIILNTDENKQREIIQEMKLQIGISFFNDLKQYILKKYPVEHELVKLFYNGK
jgi:hypothetical protein